MLPRCANFAASRRHLVATFLLIVVGCLLSRPRALAGARAPFPCPQYLEPRVEFWIDVFSRYSSRDFIVHDRDHVWKIYEVMHLPGSGSPTAREVERAADYLEGKYRRILNWFAAGGRPAGAAAQRVAAMLEGASHAELRAAAARIRVQQGLSDYFERGMVRSRRYQPMMQRIFSAHGLPPGLIFLAAVESEFNPHARSRANAVGIWQFIAATGRRYLHISRRRDERLDPERATVAAAKLLRSNYDLLGSWPLAITAYNYGAHGMARAAREYDGDYRQILEHWDGPAFGFAVKNYYSEFLAALRIYRNEERYFPDLPVPEQTPLLTADAAGARSAAAGGSAALAARCKLRRGDTLYVIARRYGVSVAALMRLNGIRDPRRLRAGRSLLIPYAGATKYARARGRHYRVRAGDTLFAIAQRAGVPLEKLEAVNQIGDPRSLDPGAILLIPAT